MLMRFAHPRFLPFALLVVVTVVGLSCRAKAPATAAPTQTDSANAVPLDTKSASNGDNGGLNPPRPHVDGAALLALVPEPRTEKNTKTFMKDIARALGENCSFCHEDSDRGRHHARIGVWMAQNFSNFVNRQTGQTVTCNDCHQGKAHLFPADENDRPDLRGVLTADVKGDKQALKRRMQAMSKALGVDCDYCHDTKDFSKPTRKQRIASWMKVELVDKIKLSNGQELSCEGCHQGKAHLFAG
ncbi:MAG: photosynthetic reaction center cytochrome c subunit family protein [Nannocystaceae bacterium]